MIMNGYYADWTASQLPPENVDWSVYDVMNYAFAEPNADGTLTFSAWNSADILTRLVSSAHGAGKRVVVSVGGWTGSAYFSSIVASSSLRSTFLQSLLDMVDTYKLDGVDLDWEYPGAMGAAGNQVSPQDAANYLVFLKELRAALPSPALITAATQVWPFYGPNGQSLPDVSEFAAIYDWILIMNYDIWGSSTTPGPNAPLSDGCKDSAQPTANAHAAVAAWSAAGMPANKITLGVPAYGYLQRSSANQLYGRRSWPAPPHKRQSLTLANSEGGTSSGQISWNSIVKQGALTLDSSGNYIGGRGFTRNWDECSSTPWLKSEASGQIVTYDDAQSLRLKGEFAKQAGLRGCSVWSLDGEYLNGRFPLSEATRGGMGI
jgi:chitinase